MSDYRPPDVVWNGHEWTSNGLIWNGHEWVVPGTFPQAPRPPMKVTPWRNTLKAAWIVLACGAGAAVYALWWWSQHLDYRYGGLSSGDSWQVIGAFMVAVVCVTVAAFMVAAALVQRRREGRGPGR